MALKVVDKSYLEQTLRDFKDDVLDEGYINKNEHSETQTIVTGTYLKKNGSCTITPKENNVVNVQNVSTDNGGAFFKVDADSTLTNVIEFHFTNIDAVDTIISFDMYVSDGTTYLSIGSFSLIGTEEQSFQFPITASIGERAIQNGFITIVAMNRQDVSYDLSVTNTIGNNLSIEQVLQNGLDEIKGNTLVGKKVLFLGDSITARTNYADSWVDNFEKISGCTKIGNVAVERATLIEFNDTVHDGNPNINNQHSNTLGNQIQKVIDEKYDVPDIIIIAIGTNGGITADETRITEAYGDNGQQPPTLDSLDTTHAEGAFRWANETLHNLYPNALICWCNPIQKATYSNNVYSWAEALRKLTSYGGVANIETNRCGIISGNERVSLKGECLKDGLHPNSKGAYKMAKYNAIAISKLFNE